MKYICFLLFLSFPCFASKQSSTELDDTTTAFEAYLVDLVNEKIINEKDLRAFAEHIYNNKKTNPIDCSEYCDTNRFIHHTNLKDHLDNELQIPQLQSWLDAFLKKRGIERKQREETTFGCAN